MRFQLKKLEFLFRNHKGFVRLALESFTCKGDEIKLNFDVFADTRIVQFSILRPHICILRDRKRTVDAQLNFEPREDQYLIHHTNFEND